MENYNISDLPLGARCSKSRASTDLVVAPFLQRACNRASGPTKIDFSKHRIVGMTPDGYPVACLVPCAVLQSRPRNDPSGQPSHQTSNPEISPWRVLPFAPLSQKDRVNSFKITLTNASPVVGDATTAVNRNRVARKERKVWRTLALQGITTAHLEHHPLDDAIAFKNYPSKQTRSSRVIPMEYHLLKKPDDSPGIFMFFALPAFRFNSETITEDV